MKPGRNGEHTGPRAAAGPPARASDSGSPPLSDRQRRHLRGLAHGLKPVVRLGSAGLTPAITRETDRALLDHELIKVKSGAARERTERDALFEELARRTASALVHRIGNIAILYRPHPELPRILLPGELTRI